MEEQDDFFDDIELSIQELTNSEAYLYAKEKIGEAAEFTGNVAKDILTNSGEFLSEIVSNIDLDLFD